MSLEFIFITFVHILLLSLLVLQKKELILETVIFELRSLIILYNFTKNPFYAEAL